MIKKLSFILISLIVFACNTTTSKDFNDMLQEKDFTVLMFFAPDCPLCLTFSKPVNELTEKYKDVKFIAVQSGEHYTAEEIEEYKNETFLIAEIYHDKNYDVAHRFNASVTPEFVLLNKEGEVLYQGLLDDRMKTLGVYKQNWDQFYLKQALEAATDGKPVATSKTTAIGCDLEY